MSVKSRAVAVPSLRWIVGRRCVNSSHALIVLYRLCQSVPTRDFNRYGGSLQCMSLCLCKPNMCLLFCTI